jgi:hypothetical protein
MDRAYSTNRENMYRLLVVTSEGKRPLGSPRLGWVNNIKINLGEIESGGVDLTGVTQGKDKWRALVNTVMNLRLP